MCEKVFIDELIANSKNKIKKSEENKDNIETEVINNIENGYIIIDNKRIEFEVKDLADHLITMNLPKEFKVMPENKAKIKYPMENRPNYIYSNEKTTINLTFNYHASYRALEEDIEETCKLSAETIKKLNPTVKIVQNEMITTGDFNIYSIEFMNEAIDSRIFNIMFFLRVKERLLMGSFNCIETEMYDWKPIAIQMISSIKLKNGV